MNSEAEIKSGVIQQCTDLGVYTAEQYIKDHARMCGESARCSYCPIYRAMNEYGFDHDCRDCDSYVNNKPNEVVAITRDWAKEHPEVKNAV